MRPWRRVDAWSLPADQILCNPIDGQQTANRRARVQHTPFAAAQI